MARIKAETLSLVADGKIIQIKKPSRLNFDLNKSLIDPSNFQNFVADPQAYCKKYDLEIDSDIAEKLKKKFEGFKSLEDVSKPGGGDHGATVWAIAKGSYSVSDTKIAVAF